MRYNLYATFRLLAGVKNGSLPLPNGTTVREAVQAIVAVHPALRPHWLDENGDVQPHVHIFANGSDVALLPDGLETPLESVAVLDFFAPVGGGCGSMLVLQR